ncbi:MAG: helix-turn-helix domain-containing protein, partial [Candidatus Omnitrophica bacterium]|nr:helix-turn-helix domain-containing protein [Candidatus Omnitrophota bacterium]
MVTSWGSYDARDLDATIFRSGINPNPGDLVYVLGTGMGADAVYAAERVGGDIRIIATDIDPYLVGNARTNVALSPYADSIRVLQANLFDFAGDADEKADRIYFNIPIDSLVAGRKKDPRTGDPGMQLLQRLLGEAASHLKEDGSLEINYMARPSFFQHVYNLGWEVADIDGQEIFDQLENAQQQAWKYLRYTLKRQDPRRQTMYDEALRDLKTLAKMEKTLLLAMTTDSAGRNKGERGTGNLSQKVRDRMRDEAQAIVRKWNEPSDMLNRVMRQTADGVWWLAKTAMHFNPRFVPQSRLNDPRFTMSPNPLSVMRRIEDQSMFAADDPVADKDRLSGIDSTGRGDQAQLSEQARARELGRRVENYVSAFNGNTQGIDVQEAAEKILARYALIPGHLLRTEDRENGTVLGYEVRRGVQSGSLIQRRVSLQLAELMDNAADRLFKRRPQVRYPLKVDYQSIGALVKFQRGDRTRKEIGQLMGVSDPILKKIEDWSELEGNARYSVGARVNLGNFLKVLNFYEIHVEQLFGREAKTKFFADYETDWIGTNMKDHRVRKGLTIDDMAAQLKMQRANYNRWESGESPPTFTNLVRIARALKVSLDELLRPNLVLNHEILRVEDDRQWVVVKERYSREGIRQRLRDLRSQRGLSLQQVANAIGRSDYYVWELENSLEGTYTIERIKTLAKFYGVSLFYLVTGLREKETRPAIYLEGIDGQQLRDNLRKVREYRGFNMRSVDRLAGFPMDTVIRLEREGILLLDYFIKISAALQIPMDVLLDEPGAVDLYLEREERWQTIADQLRAAREAAGLGVNDVADGLGLPVQRVRRIEQGRAFDARLRDVLAMANMLEVDFVMLLTGRMPTEHAEGNQFNAFSIAESFESEFGAQFKKELAAAGTSQDVYSEGSGFASGVVNQI